MWHQTLPSCTPEHLQMLSNARLLEIQREYRQAKAAGHRAEHPCDSDEAWISLIQIEMAHRGLVAPTSRIRMRRRPKLPLGA
jgi:hypothetical protein